MRVNGSFCDNCGAALQGPFCAQCGQRKRQLDPTLADLLAELGREVFDADGRIFRSVWVLFLSPGRLTNEYLAGRRVSWLPPVRLYLVVSVVYFAVSTLVGEFGIDVVIDTGAVSPSETTAELDRLGYSSADELETAIAQAQQRWLPRAMFLLLPIFAGLVQLSERRARRRYPQHLVFALHVHTAWFALFTMLAAASFVLPSGRISSVLGSLALPLAFVYLVLAHWRAYGGALWRVAWKGALLGAVYGFVVALVTLGIVLAVVLGPV